MPKERSRRSALHSSSVKLSRSKDVLEETEDPQVLVPQAIDTLESATLKKKDKQQLKREAFLRRLESTQSPYSKSHQRRLKRKAKEQIGQGLEEIRDVLRSVDAADKKQPTIAQDASASAGPEDRSQMQVDGQSSKSVQSASVQSNHIGEGKHTTLSNAQRKKALKIERLRHPLILSNPQFASNPFETIRTHAQNTLVKHV
ncbi:ribosome biogenesis protein SLX9-domain-containing protein [Lentinula raphanica]|nr:ribosome biogenesis protein SLX9-domain-containing protein [Lentinula raphanica]